MMADSEIPLTFQCFLGLTPMQEMAVFNIINGKARGLNPSLLDYHATKLTPNVGDIRLELYIAKRLQDDSASVWRGRVKMGGKATQGTHRPVSLRGLQVATKALLQNCRLGASTQHPLEKYLVVRDFWASVTEVWATAWRQPRTHLLTKGVGVNALSLLAADIYEALLEEKRAADMLGFLAYLRRLAAIDWSTTGLFRGLGGRHGANGAHTLLKKQLFASGLSVVRATP